MHYAILDLLRFNGFIIPLIPFPCSPQEKNLRDPKNKQFAICNDELRSVIGKRRESFRFLPRVCMVRGMTCDYFQVSGDSVNLE